MSMIGYDPWSFGFDVDPWSELRRMRKQLDRSFGGDVGRLGGGGDVGERSLQVQGGGGGGELGLGRLWRPACDVRETDKQLIVHAELPGVNKDDVKLEVQNDMLLLSGERKLEKRDENEKYHRIERTYGKFTRSLPLPPGVDVSNINANFENGILEVVINKPESLGGKPLTINIGSKQQLGSTSGTQPISTTTETTGTKTTGTIGGKKKKAGSPGIKNKDK